MLFGAWAACVTRSEATATAASRTGAASRIREANREAAEKARAAARSEAMIGAAQRAANREVEARARADVRAATKAANEKIRIAQRLAAEEARLRDQVLRANLAKTGLRKADVTKPGVVDAIVGGRGGTPELDALRAVRAQQKIDAAKQHANEKDARDNPTAMQFADREQKRAQQQAVRDSARAEAEKNADAARWIRRARRRTRLRAPSAAVRS